MPKGQAQVRSGDPQPEGGAESLLRVIDILDHPHGGRIARLRLERGSMPSTSDLKGARLRAIGPRGTERTLSVLGFSVTGGKVSDRRLKRTGRVDLHVNEEGDGPPVGLRWAVIPD